ncbi:50S ribosomal protein L29P [Methanoculleus chikugoensis]|jgi:large subunit ribosomal protein L29|uniref:Large ribosomal subunit protein uL29 n=2 Tax=Methanoculleus TaxID=45989 RepID=A0A1M4MNH3_9EURY|nr:MULTISPECIES: 50S ribosomal protein L29 [Methanoculleus]NMA10381.1 50S ribosomal protein L29 [Methanomicrobiales archaeon]KLK89212.1 50S ribosomal protein L29 [Methanoculleus sediminis]MDD4567479.1 50S ribosomal protein L29 [Methanoculleus chikugoensis]SCL76465.1 50S ribosomal protein L29P [Methanoculleus chikugoensis]BBL67516.1 50S ribosomal protein L29 [Methanoculleus chikugoensis]
MAIFRAREVKQLSDTELLEQEQKLSLELIQERGKVSAGGATENPGRIREVRRTIARIRTEQNARRNA